MGAGLNLTAPPLCDKVTAMKYILTEEEYLALKNAPTLPRAQALKEVFQEIDKEFSSLVAPSNRDGESYVDFSKLMGAVKRLEQKLK